MLSAGDTFINEQTEGVRSHLWVIISDPAQNENVIIVNITSWSAFADTTCILRAGAHPFVKHKSYVNYHDAQCVKLNVLCELLRKSKCRRHQPVSAGLLQKIRQGADQSLHPDGDCKKMLSDQSLI